jgi:hypothetical protein
LLGNHARRDPINVRDEFTAQALGVGLTRSPLLLGALGSSRTRPKGQCNESREREARRSTAWKETFHRAFSPPDMALV